MMIRVFPRKFRAHPNKTKTKQKQKQTKKKKQTLRKKILEIAIIQNSVPALNLILALTILQYFRTVRTRYLKGPKMNALYK